ATGTCRTSASSAKSSSRKAHDSTSRAGWTKNEGCYPARRTRVNRFFRSALFPLVVIFSLASQTLIPHKSSTQKLSYTEVYTRIQNGTLTPNNVVFEPSGHGTGTIVVHLQASGGPTYKVNYASDQAQLQFQDLLLRKHIDFDAKGLGGSPWWGILTS